MSYTSREVYEYISAQTSDPIVEWKICRVSWVEFPIYQSDLDFYEKISPTFAGQKFAIPTPTLCPEERQRRRLTFRNERNLYKRKCDFSGEQIISNYSPDKDYIVYSHKNWWSDVWNDADYALPIDETISFSTHYNQLLHTVPHISLMVKMNENCDYVNGCGNSKDCYLVFDTDFCENSLYSSIIKHSQYVFDSTHIYYCQYIYNSINCSESYHLMNCRECDQSKHLSYCIMCSNCEYCVWCSNLVGKKYCINNIQYTKQEYEQLVATTIPHYPDHLLQRTTYKVHDEGGVGNNLYSTKNCVLSYNIWFSEGVRYSDLVTDCHYSYDISSFGGTTQWSLECVSIGLDCSHVYFSNVITAGSNHIYYSTALIGCHHMFGCAFMKNKSYCIFNKQYTKEEYEKRVADIIGRMQETGERWEFFHPSLSPFGYNETVAQEYYPLSSPSIPLLSGEIPSRVEGKTVLCSSPERGVRGKFNRSDYSSDPKIPDTAQVIKPQEIDDETWKRLRDDDTILRQVIVCVVSWRPFMIQKAELEFYRKYDLPLPRKHPDVRHEERAKLRPGRTLHMRNCDKCEKEMLSVYPSTMAASDKPQVTETWDLQLEAWSQTVYCESCYQKKVYG
jgi:hypothetical protein